MTTALTIAGSDSSGGAGVQADLKVFTVLGVFGTSAVTAVTAQNTLGVTEAFDLSPALVRRQIDAVATDVGAGAAKTGMLSNAAIIEAVADAIIAHRLRPYVCDPVMYAKSGASLIRDDAVGALVKRLIPLAAVVTPNRREATGLAGVPVESLTSVAAGREVARRIVDAGAAAVVVKTLPAGDGRVADLLYDGRDFTELGGPRLASRATHGSGCAFSAAITAHLARGAALADAVAAARAFVATAIRHETPIGRGACTPVNVLAAGAR